MLNVVKLVDDIFRHQNFYVSAVIQDTSEAYPNFKFGFNGLQKMGINSMKHDCKTNQK